LLHIQPLVEGISIYYVFLKRNCKSIVCGTRINLTFRRNDMNIAVLGTGQVAIALAKGAASRGHQVVFGTRDIKSETALHAAAELPTAKLASYEGAAKFADMALLATAWSGTENALKLAGAENLAGKIVIDVTNPLDFSSGKPRLALGFPHSAGAQIQQWLPNAQVVKAFNIITATRMVDPVFPDGHADMFIAGNNVDAKLKVSELIKSFGWRSAIDMGDIGNSYLLEALAMTWIEYGVNRNHWTHGFSLLSA
jgi:8-hydroxy-5-deazaflavin:NADPH oxidoreductase